MSLKDSLFMALDQFQQKHVLVVGDVMLDEYHWCQVRRISPEAPVPVCEVEKTTHLPGGAGNVAHNLIGLSKQVSLLGVMGCDHSSEKLIRCYSDLGILTTCLIQDQNYHTILKSRVMANHQQMFRLDRDGPKAVDLAVVDQLIHQFDALICDVDGVIVSDYAKGTLGTSFLKHIFSAAKKNQVPIIVDPKGNDYSKYHLATVIKPNFKEFCAVFKCDDIPDCDFESYAQQLIRELKLKALLLTRAEQGMDLFDQDHRYTVSAQSKEVFDVTGAGDTVISVFTLGVLSGLSFQDAAYLANQAAGIVVSKLGASTVDFNQLSDLVSLL